MLNERSQSWKDEYCLTSLYEVPGIFKFIETESRTEVNTARGGGMRDCHLMGSEFLFQGEKVLEICCATM